MKAILTRQQFSDKQTLGKLELFNGTKTLLFSCFTLELPWLNNSKKTSCIPKGDYDVVIRTSPKYGLHFHITNVKNRDLILIHNGNYYTQILGCVLVGSGLIDLNGDKLKDLTNSVVTLKKLLKLAPSGFKLSIL